MQEAPAHQGEGTRRSWGQLATYALVLAGIAARLAFFLPDTSLWGDEAAVALNLEARTPRQLLAPLDDNQHAPLGFLLTEKLLFSACGLNERCLRLPALLSSILSLVLFSGLTARTLGPAGRWLPVGLFAMSPALVRYGAELKPYSTDVLATVLIAWAALDVLNGERRPGRLVVWGASAAVLVWWSFAAVIVLFGAGVVLTLRQLRAEPSGVPRLLLLVLPAAVSFLVEHRLVAGVSLQNRELIDFWSYAFIPFPPSSLWDVRTSLAILTNVFRNPLGMLDTAFPSAIAAIGLVSIFRSRPSLAAILVAPIAVTAVLSSLHLWPFASRLILFLCPLIVILFGAGVRVITASSPGHVPLMVVALATFCGPIVGLRETLQSPERSGVRAALEHFEPQMLSGDVVYVYYKSATAFRLYGRRILQGRPLAVTVGHRIDGSSATASRDVKQLVGHPRVWLLFSEVNTYWTDERSLVTGMLDQFGQRKRSYEADGAFLYLYDLRGDITQAPPGS